MHPTVAVISCTGDPWRCAEADVEALASLGVKAIINPGPEASVDVVKISHTSRPRGMPRHRRGVVAGPGVDEGALASARVEALIKVGYGEGRIRVHADGIDTEPSLRGCHGIEEANMLAALAAGYLATGLTPARAVEEAISHLEEAISYWGCRPRPSARLEARAHRLEAMEQVGRALDMLIGASNLVLRAGLVPEVGINIAMAPPAPYARGPGDVVAVPGRVRVAGGILDAIRCPAPGASSHLARAILEVMKTHPQLRGAVNVLYTKELVTAAGELGYAVSSYDRRLEPREVKEAEGATIPWGIRVALDRLGGAPPDLVYHYGDWGKEAMAIVFGRTAVEAVGKLVSIASRIVGV